MLKNPLITWVEKNRITVAAASVLGSFAGLLFSIVDLKESLGKRKRLKAAKKGT